MPKKIYYATGHEPGPLVDPTAFITTWNTANTSTGSSATNQVSIPTTAAGSYNANVDWGDGNIDTGITSHSDTRWTHTYASAGIYTITITGTFKGFQFNNTGDRLKLLDVSQWGNMEIAPAGDFMEGAANVIFSAADAPSNVASIVGWPRSFRGCSSLTGGIAHWPFTGIIDAASFLNGASSFDERVDHILTSSFTSGFAFLLNASSWSGKNLADCVLTSCTINTAMFMNTSITQANYEAALVTWESDWIANAGSMAMSWEFTGATYSAGSAAETAKNNMIAAGFSFTDGGAV